MEKVEQIIKKFQNFYGKNNIVVNGLSDDKDNNGDKIDRTEIIIKSKEAVTLEAYEDGEVDVIIDDIEINKDNIPLYYEFMNEDDLVNNKTILHSIFNERCTYISRTLDLGMSDDLIMDEYTDDKWTYDIGLESFEIKDTLKPIDEYIEEIKNSDNYKNYVGEKPLNKIINKKENKTMNNDEKKSLPEIVVTATGIKHLSKNDAQKDLIISCGFLLEKGSSYSFKEFYEKIKEYSSSDKLLALIDEAQKDDLKLNDKQLNVLAEQYSNPEFYGDFTIQNKLDCITQFCVNKFEVPYYKAKEIVENSPIKKMLEDKVDDLNGLEKESSLNKIIEQYDESQLNQTKIKVLDDKQIEDVIKEIDAKPIDSAENVVATIFTKDGEYDVFYRNKDSDKFFDVCKVNKEYGDYDAIDGVKFTNLTTSGLEEIKEFISNRENLENTQEETETKKSKPNRQR